VITKIKTIYNEFPVPFWTLMGASFIDRIGGALLYPFFALYITDHFGVGMTEVGILFAIFSISAMGGSFVAGALTDKFGRRSLIIFGLFMSASTSLMMAYVNDLTVFYGVAVLSGLFANAGQPAQQAMVADLLPEEQRAEGYGIWRIIANLAVSIGPAIGGFLATRSYTVLFYTDAVTSLIMIGLVLLFLPETKPELSEENEPETVAQTIKGYGRVLRDHLFMLFLLASTLTTMVYVQIQSSLPVYLRDEYAISAQQYGFILSLNAAMVVLFQFWITRRTKNKRPFHMLALGTALYGIGFGMYGFVSAYWLFLVAMVIITIGEMILSPVAQAMIATFAPPDMRGRYMAMAGISWMVPFAVGPLVAGVTMDNYNPDWVWYASAITAAVAVMGYFWLNGRVTGKPAADEETKNGLT